MKYLVLALCVCAASAASFDYKPYVPVKQVQGFRQPEASPFAAKTTYNAAQFVANAPVVAAKTTYNSAQFVANSPAVAAKTTYNAAKFVATAPVVAAKTTYSTAKFVANSPVVAAKTTYDAAKFIETAPFVAASPVVADTVVVGAKSVYNVPQDVNNTPIVAKPVYEAAQFVASGPAVAAKAAYDNSRVLTTAPKNVYYAGKEAEAGIVSSDSDVTAEGYNYAYKTSNGIEAQSYGALKTVEDANVLVSQGSYQYPAPDGTLVKFEYVADENGYQPRSDLLPVAPPVPSLIAKSLEYLRTHPQKPENY